MTWVNPLDKVPQIPVDWANHIAQGGIAACVIALLLAASGKMTVVEAVDAAGLLMLLVSGLKKAVDFFKEHESAQVCLGKTLVTVIWPASMMLAVHATKGG